MQLPLLSPTIDLDAPLAWRGDQPVSRATFLSHVAGVARQLPSARFIINLCEDRYRFLVAFAAVGVNGQTSLLPSSRAVRHLQQLTDDYPDSHTLTDDHLATWLAAGSANSSPSGIPHLPVTQTVAIAFTSGTIGRAKPNPKRWGELVNGARQAQHRFGFVAGMTLVATVPPQHMYGLETSIMAPLAGRVSIHAGRPFFPDDVRVALQEVPKRRVLVTTPVHLHACVKAGLCWPETAFLISATAPLSAELAAQAQAAFNAPVLEIYGCTEAGSIASRHTLSGDRWRLYDGFALAGGRVSGAHLPEPISLGDVVEAYSATEFRLLGRSEDLINIVGKRSSLAYLNHQLSEIAGVVEGVFLMPAETGTGVDRLIALVVAPQRSERQLLAALAERLDPVFLPRPLIKVETLPRNETGKITRESLLRLMVELGRGTDGH